MESAHRLVITAVALLVLAIAPAHAQIVALGASNTAGKGVGAAQAFPAQLEAMLKSRGSGMRVTNAGVSGNTTGDMLGRLGSAVPAGTKIVIVQYGGNDARQGKGAERAGNIARIEGQLTARGIRIVQADGLVSAALRAGLRQSDGIHLTVAGHRQVAEGLLGSIR